MLIVVTIQTPTDAPFPPTCIVLKFSHHNQVKGTRTGVFLKFKIYRILFEHFVKNNKKHHKLLGVGINFLVSIQNAMLH